MEDSKLRKVYDTIVKEGYDVPDFATFETDMRDDNKLTQVRDRLVEDGYELPEFGQFKIDMFGAPQPQETTPQQESKAIDAATKGGENGYTFTAQELGIDERNGDVARRTVWGEESIASPRLPEVKPINVHLTDRQLKELREMPDPERNEAVESGSFLTDEHKKAREEFDAKLSPANKMAMKDSSISHLGAPAIPKEFKYDYDFKKEFGYFPGGSDTEFWNFLKTKTGEEYQMKMFGRPLSDYEIAKLSEDARRLGFWGTVGQGFKGLGYGLKGVELELAEGIADLFGVEHAKENINEERERILTAQDNFKPTAEGVGGFVAEMIPQMTGTGLGLLVSAVNPVAGAAIVNASTAAQVASSMGSTALEARRAGASDAQTAIAMLLSGGAELLSEKYVNSKYIKRIMPKAADVVAEAGDKALESELNKLLQTARKELGGKFTAKTAKDLVGDMFVEGASEFSAEAVQALIPIVYEHKEDFPNIVEVFNAGLEGFAGGVFMGGIFGGTSSLIQNRANNRRRREQGFVDVANVEIGGKPTFVEVLGKDKDGNFVVLNGDETVSIKESQIKELERFDYNDFRNAEVEYAREIGYEQEPTGENAVKEANEYANARNKVVKVLVLAEGADVDAMLEGRTAEEIAMGDAEVEDAVNNYIKARARRDGFRERYQEERDRQFAESDKSIDERTNNGTVYSVATENGEAFITSGTVVLNEEGEIDYANSEKLVVMFPDGTIKPVQRGSLPGEVTVQNAEDLKAAGRASIEERWRAEFESAENAYVEQQKRREGVVFDVTDKEGTHRVEVVKEGEVISNVLVDGEQMQISTEMLNALRGEAGVTQAESGKALQTESGEVKGENEVQPEVAPVVEGENAENAEKVVEPVGEVVAFEQNIPVDEKGKKMWEQSTPEYIAEYIRVRKPEDVEAQMSVVSGMIEGLEKQKSKMDAMDAMDIDDKIAFWKKVGELIGGAKDVVDPISQLNAKHSSALTAFNSMLENIRREGNEQKAAIRYEGLENMVAELGKQLPEGYTIGVVDGKYTIVEAQPVAETTPVVESASVVEEAQPVEVVAPTAEEVALTEGENNAVSTLKNGDNELNLQKENESDNESNQNDIPVGGQVPQSVPQGEHGTQDSQVSGMEETASRLRERIEADGGTPQGGLSRNARDVENRVTREYAQENGLWIPFEDVFKLGRPSKSGNEHDTYLNAEQGVIYKVNNRMNTPSILDLLDRMEQHNEFFPDSKYSLVGFTAVSENGDVWPVFAQEYVPNARMATNEEIDSYMGALGFTRVGDGRYSNGEVVIKDLKPRNVLADADGDIYVVDAEFEQEKAQKGDKTAENKPVESEPIKDEAPVTSETTEQPETGEVANAGPVNMETLQLNMSEEDFNALLSSGDKAAISEYLAEMDGLLRIGVGSPLDGRDAIVKEYRGLVEQYGGEENIPADVVAGIDERIAPYNALQRAVFDRKYALQDKLREIEASEAQAKEQAEKEAKAEHKQTAFGGFLADKTDLAASTAEKALNKKYNFDGKVMTVAEFVEDAVGRGDVKLSAIEEPKYKGASRAAWNRMDARQQEADAKRVKESGTKTVYTVNDHDLGKTAYDYAKFLQEKKAVEQKPKEKIEDVGEVLAGARKDELKVIASSFENATAKSLIELPFSKAFKKPDLKKAVESGALREEDALFYEAMFNALINSSKPKNSARHRNAVETWAEETYNSLQLIKSFVEADEVARDRAMAEALEDKFPARAEELAVIEKRKVWNARNNAEWGDKTTPNPVWVTHEVLKALGYKPGDKVEIPFGVLKANVFATGYEFYNKKGDRLIMQAVPTVEEGIENIVWLSKIKRGDADTQHPVASFFATPTKRDMGDSGRYYVLWGTVRNPRRSEFGSIEEANAFTAGHKEAVVRPIQEVVKRYGYKIVFRNPLTGDKFFVNDMEFETEGEAMQYLEDNYDAVNEQTNELLAKERGEAKKEVSADDLLEVAMVRGKEGWKYAVNIKGKYANNMGMPLLLREFDTREDAKAFLNESKNEVFEIYKKQQAEQKKFVFFDTGENSRIGEDYRGGRDVTAQDFMDTFGFRGVQFGNWTNQDDRQMAVNQAFDAFLDLAKLLGVSPKALSLNGELGMAFGSRGSGFGNAHYELGEIVINLTKTRGAGSLAHEWWHALDNYFARRANVPMGMVTDSRSIDMRPELRQAYNDLLKMIEESDFYKRSKARGDYWGRMHEVTARLMAEWVDQSLKDKGELNTFLSRGVNEERYKRMNYDTHRAVSLIKGKEAMSYEEFEKTPEALAGFPYPSREELKEFGDAMRNIFETVEEQETEEGKVALYNKARKSSPVLEGVKKMLSLAKTNTPSNEKAIQEVSGRGQQSINKAYFRGIPEYIYDALERAGRRPTAGVKVRFDEYNMRKPPLAETEKEELYLQIVRMATNREIENEILPILEEVAQKAKSETARVDAQDFIRLIERFKRRNERGYIIRDLSGAELDTEIPLSKIDELFSRYNSDDEVAEIYERVRAIAEDVGLTFSFSEKEFSSDNVFGEYRLYDNSVIFNDHMLYSSYMTQQKKATTIVHEIIHAVTQYAIDAYKNGDTKLPAELRDAAKKIIDIYEKVVKNNPALVKEETDLFTNKTEIVPEYGTTDVYEMISELSNPEFRDKLKQIEYDNRSVLKRLWDAIKSIFIRKNKEKESVYNHLSSAFSTFVENFDGPAYNRSRGISVGGALQMRAFQTTENGDVAAEDEIRFREGQEGETLFSKKKLTPEQKKKQEALKENAKAIRRLHNVTSKYPITALRNLGFALETQEQRDMHDRLFAERDAITGESKGVGIQVNPKAMTLQERITEGILKLAEKEKENVEMRLSAIRAYGRDLANVIKLMNAQKGYDRRTVEAFTDLVKMYLRNNAMKGLSSYEIIRLLNLMQKATGGREKVVYNSAVKIAEIITYEHTRQLEEIMDKQMKTGAERVNASGVVVQGGVDIIGKRILNTYKDAINLDDKGFEEKYNSTFERVGKIQKQIQENGSNTALENQLKEAEAEADAMLLAATYRNEVKAANTDIDKVKKELRKKREAMERGEVTRKEYYEFANTINAQRIQLRAQQIDAYQKVLHALSGDIYEGVQRARAFREAEAMRVQRIHDMAESDMNGVDKSAERKEPGMAGKAVDMVVYKNPLVRTVMNGLGTYETYMKYFGRDHLDGRGELFNHFMTAFTEAQNKEWKESQNDFNILEAAAQNIFGKKRFGKTYKSIALESTKPSGVVLEYWNGGAKVERELTIGQLMYLYMTEKQVEGQMKLRNMGLTEEKVQSAIEKLPAKYKQFADYIQSQFLPQMRPRMNEVHQRMFGASMSEVENYFPLRVNQDARNSNEDLNNSTDAIPSTITGSIIKRRVNVTPIDLMANAFDVLNEHIVDMEHWAAFAEFTRDNNTLINDKDFKNRVQNTSSVRYGDGKTLWKDFVETAKIATGNYQERKNFIAKLMKGANAAKITFGYFTALKQLASLPAFWSDAKIWDAVWYSVNPMGSWKWAIENLPGFEERWKGRTAGNERLEENEYSIHDSRMMKAARMVGMTPNAFVDAVVVASGARAVYADRLRFYKALGMTEYLADKRAKTDAAISYNETQQSGQGAYLSTLQKGNGLDTLLLTLFRNAQMAFQRRVVGSLVEIGKKLARGEKIREATKQKYIKMGMSEEAAGKQANKDFCKAYAKDITNLAIFGYGMNYVWALMGELPYLLFGDDEEEKEKIWDTAAKIGATGTFEGFALGNFAKGLYEKHITDGKYLVGLLEAPFETDLQQVLDRFEKDGTIAGVLQLAIFATEMNTGISPQRLIDTVAAIIDFSNGDLDTATEAQLLALRLMKVPQSQLDKLILDETHGASAEEVKEIAERYIEYKMKRNLPFGSEDEKRVDKYANKFVETLKERVEKEYAPEDISVIFDQSSDTEKEILKKKWIKGMDERNGTNVARSLRKEKIEELLGSPMEKAAQKALHGITKETPYEYLETFEDLQEFYEIKSKQKALEPLFEAYKEELKTLNEDEQNALFQKNEKMVRLYNLLKRKEQVISNNKKWMKNNPEKADEYMGNIRRLRAEAIDLINKYNE